MKKTFLTLIIPLCFSLLTVGCNDDSKGDNPLAGTKWKLVGFVDDQTSTTKEPQPSDCVECYLLSFDTNETFSGHSMTNVLWGSYQVVLSSGIFLFTNIGGTEINELFDGREFMDALGNVTNFILSKEELKLCYKNNLYLLFNPK